MSTLPPPDNINPSYIVVNPDGTISAQFSGVIFAQGLILPAGIGSGGPTNSVIWRDPSTLVSLATIQTFFTTGGVSPEAILNLSTSPEAGGGIINLDAADSTQTRQGTLQAIGLAGAGNTKVKVGAIGDGGNAGLTLLTDKQTSDLAQIANNLSDLASAATARTNLAVLAIANNLSDLQSVVTARANLAVLGIANNLSDLASAATARTNLGFQASRAYRAAAWTSVTVATQIAFDTFAGSGFAAGTYTCPIAGTYRVSARAQVTSTATTQWLYIVVYKNGVATSYGQIGTQTVTGQGISSVVNDEIVCAAGDTLQVLQVCSTAGLTGVVGSPFTHFSVALAV